MAAPVQAPPATARHDLRAHLQQLEELGKLVRVSRPINKDTELHPLVRWQFRGLPESERRAFMFENVHDSRGRQYSMPVVVGVLAGSEDIYALSIGCPSEKVLETWQRALAKPLSPVVVEGAPVQELVYQGESLMAQGGLDELPVPISTPGFDNAPYFNSAIWITKDPETGVRNAGVYRGMLKSPLRTGVFCDSGNNTALNWEKHNALGKPMHAAAVIGSPPAVYLSAIQMAPVGVDELAVASAILGQPVETVRCKTVDLEVPAQAEIVVEGIIRTDVLEPEGSFGEAHGYQDPRSLSFTFEVTAIT
ncbi:MAG TPA: UbiD family decarboxylase, partial [Chloroflexota bacterium]|nr:UbiD family decarboxylase [Chloroflexota bacterium]